MPDAGVAWIVVVVVVVVGVAGGIVAVDGEAGCAVVARSIVVTGGDSGRATLLIVDVMHDANNTALAADPTQTRSDRVIGMLRKSPESRGEVKEIRDTITHYYTLSE